MFAKRPGSRQSAPLIGIKDEDSREGRWHILLHMLTVVQGC